MVEGNDECTVLSLNSGSSSLKLGLYSFQNGTPVKVAWGEAEELGSSYARVWLHGALELASTDSTHTASAGEAAQYFIEKLQNSSAPRPQAIGHRIVHGGPRLPEQPRIAPGVLVPLGYSIRFAPLHLSPWPRLLDR